MSNKILWENNYLPFMIFYYRKSLFKIAFGKNILNCQPIFEIFAAHFRTNYAPDVAKKIFYHKVPKFSDARNLCCNLPKIQTKRPKLKVFC